MESTRPTRTPAIVTGFPSCRPSTSVNSTVYRSLSPRTGTERVLATSDAHAAPTAQKPSTFAIGTHPSFIGSAPRFPDERTQHEGGGRIPCRHGSVPEQAFLQQPEGLLLVRSPGDGRRTAVAGLPAVGGAVGGGVRHGVGKRRDGGDVEVTGGEHTGTRGTEGARALGVSTRPAGFAAVVARIVPAESTTVTTRSRCSPTNPVNTGAKLAADSMVSSSACRLSTMLCDTFVDDDSVASTSGWRCATSAARIGSRESSRGTSAPRGPTSATPRRVDRRSGRPWLRDRPAHGRSRTARPGCSGAASGRGCRPDGCRPRTGPPRPDRCRPAPRRRRPRLPCGCPTGSSTSWM